jgi:general secretion pathway protein B
MSLILDALNRSRQDNEQVPGLDSHHLADSALAGSEGGIGWVQWLLVAGLALAVLVIGWLLLDRMPSAAEVPAGENKKTPVVVTVPATAAAENTPAQREAAVTQREKITEAPAVPAATVSLRDRPVMGAPKQESARAPVDTSVAALYQQQGQGDDEPQAATQPAPEPVAALADEPAAAGAQEEAIDIEKLVTEAQAELADDRLQDNGVPFLATLSQQTKDTVPTLMYQRHDYSGNPGKSSVLINGKTLSAGASVGGVKVVEILPESVVLDFKGARFRLRALNSWVNL